MEESPQPPSPREKRARLARADTIARRLGFVGTVEYRHVATRSGGAQYEMGPVVEQDVLAVYDKAFQRDMAGDDFSLEAIIAHERGHQVLWRHDPLRRNLPQHMSVATEEVLASLVGSLIAEQQADSEALILKALLSLVERGIQGQEATQRVQEILSYLEAIL